jgi:pimeloyl-ACP methyl ester carboxylesterase
VLPDRVLGVVPCCAMTDMRYPPARATMSRPHALAVWDAPDRDAARDAAIASHGLDGSRILSSGEGPPLPRSDLALLQDPVWGRAAMANLAAAFAQGVEGYVDDRLADGEGWTSFDVTRVRCPTIIVHGSDDVICRLVHAEHTATLVPHAELRLFPGLGHFSVVEHAVAAAAEIAAR